MAPHRKTAPAEGKENQNESNLNISNNAPVYEDYTVVQLRGILKTLSLDTKGKKAQLIERLKENDASKSSNKQVQKETTSVSTNVAEAKEEKKEPEEPEEQSSDDEEQPIAPKKAIPNMKVYDYDVYRRKMGIPQQKKELRRFGFNDKKFKTNRDSDACVDAIMWYVDSQPTNKPVQIEAGKPWGYLASLDPELSCIDLTQDCISFGRLVRGEKSEINQRLAVPEMNRVHCKIVRDNGKVFLEDLGSTLGTFINEQRLEKGVRSEVKHHDTISFGTVAPHFYYVDATMHDWTQTKIEEEEVNSEDELDDPFDEDEPCEALENICRKEGNDFGEYVPAPEDGDDPICTDEDFTLISYDKLYSQGWRRQYPGSKFLRQYLKFMDSQAQLEWIMQFSFRLDKVLHGDHIFYILNYEDCENPLGAIWVAPKNDRKNVSFFGEISDGWFAGTRRNTDEKRDEWMQRLENWFNEQSREEEGFDDDDYTGDEW